MTDASTRFLALLVGAAPSEDKAEISPQQAGEFLEAWSAWATEHAAAIEDSGSPLGPTTTVGADAVERSTNSWVAWMIVRAASASDAAAIVQAHPHVALSPGNRVELIELLTIPTGPPVDQ